MEHSSKKVRRRINLDRVTSCQLFDSFRHNLKLWDNPTNQGFVDPILRYFAQQIIDLFLKCHTLFALQPVVPVVKAVPGAYNFYMASACQGKTSPVDRKNE
jgi:hypothetical protein